jgi:hypothetical protein
LKTSGFVKLSDQDRVRRTCFQTQVTERALILIFFHGSRLISRLLKYIDRANAHTTAAHGGPHTLLGVYFNLDELNHGCSPGFSCIFPFFMFSFRASMEPFSEFF